MLFIFFFRWKVFYQKVRQEKIYHVIYLGQDLGPDKIAPEPQN
jgi:hypothetical protein